MNITLTANAGVILEIGGARIWVDALHDRKTPPFSTETAEIWEKLQELSAPDYILYTHYHPDHYSEKLTQSAQKRWPLAKIIAPEGKFAAPLSVMDGDLAIQYLPLPHEGAQYKNVVHYGILLSVSGEKVLIPGDCALAAEELAGLEADVLILDFPWVTTSKGRAFLEKHFQNVEIVLVHLPFAEDDRFGYRIAAARAAEKDKKVHILQNLLETLTL